MTKYTVIYEVVESYDATLEGDFDYHSLRKAVEDGHYQDTLDRSWRDGSIKVVDIWKIEDAEVVND